VASTVARIGRITTQPRNPEAARTLETADKRGHLQTAETGSSETWVGSLRCQDHSESVVGRVAEAAGDPVAWSHPSTSYRLTAVAVSVGCGPVSETHSWERCVTRGGATGERVEQHVVHVCRKVIDCTRLALLGALAPRKRAHPRFALHARCHQPHPDTVCLRWLLQRKRRLFIPRVAHFSLHLGQCVGRF
jgi:hypothetical protein